MKKRIVLTIVGLIVLVAGIAGIKALQIGRMVAQGKDFAPPPERVNAFEATREQWETLIPSVGSLDAVQGVTVTTELSGKVVNIAFEPGGKVKAGDLLIKQDTASEEARLRAAEAALNLARINFQRARGLLARKAISESDYDNADAQYKSAAAEVDGIRVLIEKKTIRAPFAGRLGIRLVNMGELLREGDPVVSLQALDPVFVNFLLPQQEIARVKPGMTVRVTSNALPGLILDGTITAINPEVESATRNVRIQATITNPEERLRPGMFVNVDVVMPEPKPVVVIPETAVLYAPYGDSVFVVETAEGDADDKTHMTLRQQFVRLGDKKGDFTAVSSGLREGELVVSTGVFKLRNGQTVVIDNTLSPVFEQSPTPENR
ncbi:MULTISPECIES: efflux RND transporter periplasmic adaptor subunit [Desulfococcus]|jgi:membrane fusion protein (multidrug efflux system)|uniref:Efflux transporter, RND family, MFP subunit n=1 Tax=Desulfococcus multivorans DSM 2059 TaxID=1121405 RepID=S7TZI6_DESML|nr:efflux RND transporter periplasmic adaptor subunit [Desulfococcus multivorans]AOY59392.1 efflux transporter, RND family, membrane fusion protein, related to acrB [Desulfococcus multivorans]AQV01603.1 MexH family multidrug efflux RND transporter periplasmic adaptor subunit [Desulfococcus multivorans]EPR42145.1 efflux transporter, RND family, MFP subunit [Desulfococcus multivorans DSM 2059]SJZ99847.1 membrane fusion protein, multidrug efflux system [Desulfococcus multivorans DSM 2059]